MKWKSIVAELKILKFELITFFLLGEGKNELITVTSSIPGIFFFQCCGSSFKEIIPKSDK